MPFVSIRILEGHSQQRKDIISRRVTDAISEVAELPREAIWVVFEDISADDWYVGASSVRALKAAQGGATPKTRAASKAKAKAKVPKQPKAAPGSAAQAAVAAKVAP